MVGRLSPMLSRADARRARLVRAVLALVIVMVALLPRAAAAANSAVVSGTDGEGVWLKAGPHVSTARLALLEEGTPLTVLGGPRASDDGYHWFNVEAEGQRGWLVGDYVKQTTSAPPPQATPHGLAPGGYARVRGVAAYGGLKLRAGPTPWDELLLALQEGIIIQVVGGPRVGGNGNPWYTVAHAGLVGWVDGSYLVPSAPPAPLAPAMPGLAPGGMAVVTGVREYGGLRLRAAPAPWEAQIATLPEGTTLRILEGPTLGGNSDPWFRLAWGNSWGWASGVYLRPGGAVPVGDEGIAAFIQVALAQLGKPYVWGAVGPDSFDCSGLTYYAAVRTLGIILPRVADQQAFSGVHVDRADLLPGDLVFYENTYGPGITHVGIYIGNNWWVSAADERSGVVISTLDEPYWKSRYAGARRIT